MSRKRNSRTNKRGKQDRRERGQRSNDTKNKDAQDPIKKLRKKFSNQVISEAEQLSEKISGKELKYREDFRKIFTCTIDPADSKDFDDALSVRELEDGLYEIGVNRGTYCRRCSLCYTRYGNRYGSIQTRHIGISAEQSNTNAS